MKLRPSANVYETITIQTTLLVQGYALYADCGVFGGLIGPWVHVRMEEWLEKPQRAIKAQERQRQKERDGETNRETTRKHRHWGKDLTEPTKPYGATERGNVIGLGWDMYTSVPTNQPGVMCDSVSKRVPVHSDVHIPACAHGGYIDIFFFTAHICQCLYLGPVKGLNSTAVITQSSRLR